MKQALINFFRHIHRFGLSKGFEIYCSNTLLKKGVNSLLFKTISHPIFLRRSTSDIPTFNQVFLNREYEYSFEILPQFIIDCGANIGLATVFFKNKYPNAFVVSVEPENSNFEQLKKNTSLYSKIECIKSGIWNKNAILKVEDEFHFGNWGFTCKEVFKEDENTVNAISIKEIMNRYNYPQIDILKIDIEGAELELFNSNFEEWLPFTKVIIIELHDRFRRGCSKSFFTALNNYDFSLSLHGENLICIQN